MRRVQNVRSEVAEERKEDENETDVIKTFSSSGCGCQLQDGGQCSSSFLEAHFAEYRSNCLELSKGELDILIMGQIYAFTNRSIHTLHTLRHRHSEEERKKEYSTFRHQGLLVCRTTFLFLHTIGLRRYEALKDHVREFGVTPRKHKLCKKQPANAFSLEDTKRIVTFIVNYAERQAVSLPGRIPGFKRDDILVLPCSQKKKEVWQLYHHSLSELPEQPRIASYSLFCQTWNKLLPHIVISKPLTDLCAECHQNSRFISSAYTCSDQEKQKVTRQVTYPSHHSTCGLRITKLTTT